MPSVISLQAYTGGWVLWILLAHSCLSAEAGTPCPTSCYCSLLKDNTVSARCRLDVDEDYAAIQGLPSNTTRLICLLSGKLKEDLLELKSLWRLEQLAIVPEKHDYYIMAKYTNTLTHFNRGDLLQNLSSLESFRVNVPASVINPRILDPVPNLTNLDLSHTGLNTYGHIRSLLQNMTLSGHRLQTLNLSAVQRHHISGTPEPIYLRDDIYVNIQEFPIKTLDLMGNEVVALQAGLTAYLPQLEVARVGSKRLFYIKTDKPHSRACFNLDFFLHPSLRELDVSFPDIVYYYTKAKRSTSDHVRSQGGPGMILKCLIDALTHSFQDLLCTFVNCMCQGVVHTPCENIQKVNWSDLVDFKNRCYLSLRIPVPPQLERLSVTNLNVLSVDDSNTIQNFTLPDFPGNFVKGCFSLQNKLRYVDISSRIKNRGLIQFVPMINLDGLTKLDFVNMQGNSLLITPTTRLFSGMPLLKTLLLGGNSMDLTLWKHLDFLQLTSLESLDLESCHIPIVPRDSVLQTRTFARVESER